MTVEISGFDFECIRAQIQALRVAHVLRAINQLTEWLADQNDHGIENAIACLELADEELEVLNRLCGIPIPGTEFALGAAQDPSP